MSHLQGIARFMSYSRENHPFKEKAKAAFALPI